MKTKELELKVTLFFLSGTEPRCSLYTRPPIPPFWFVWSLAGKIRQAVLRRTWNMKPKPSVPPPYDVVFVDALLLWIRPLSKNPPLRVEAFLLASLLFLIFSSFCPLPAAALPPQTAFAFIRLSFFLLMKSCLSLYLYLRPPTGNVVLRISTHKPVYVYDSGWLVATTLLCYGLFLELNARKFLRYNPIFIDVPKKRLTENLDWLFCHHSK